MMSSTDRVKWERIHLQENLEEMLEQFGREITVEEFFNNILNATYRPENPMERSRVVVAWDRTRASELTLQLSDGSQFVVGVIRIRSKDRQILRREGGERCQTKR